MRVLDKLSQGLLEQEHRDVRYMTHPDLGTLRLEGSVALGLTGVHFSEVPEATVSESEDDLLLEAEAMLVQYLKGKWIDFSSLNLNPVGSDFQRSVWQQLQTIPYGETRSYKWLASQLGKPSASRAVGNANGKNPISIIIPCHRVVHHDGGLGGYSSGLARKRFLLSLESKASIK